jgi:catechol 2,3-dioxygenase-like lactoylglutathione lyase family enzyme
MSVSKINHLYLVIKNFEQNISFYQQLFEIMEFSQSYKSEEINFICFKDKTDLTIGLLEESIENKDLLFDRFRVGMSQIAFNLENKNQLEKVLDFTKEKKVDFRFEDKIEEELHHGENFYTISFFCPSGILFEFVVKKTEN